MMKCLHSFQQQWTNKALLFSYNVTFNVLVLRRDFTIETLQTAKSDLDFPAAPSDCFLRPELSNLK